MSYTFTLQRLSNGRSYVTLEEVRNDRILQLLLERTKTSWTFDPLVQIYTYEDKDDRTY